MSIIFIVSIIISLAFASRLSNLLIVNFDFILNDILIMGLVVTMYYICIYL